MNTGSQRSGDKIPERETLFGLLLSLSEAMDMVHPLLMDHHKRTAWFGVNLAEAMGLDRESVKNILLASLLHDIGAFSLKERLDTLQFEFENPHHHACLGYNLLKDIKPLENEARIILAHHVWWRPQEEGEVGGEQTPIAAHVVHLADRVALFKENHTEVLSSAGNVLDHVVPHRGTMFMPDAVDALVKMMSDGDQWPGFYSQERVEVLKNRVDSGTLVVTGSDLEHLVKVFARIIDYRSPFTATHSAGVAAVTQALARILGFSDENCRTARLAGYLHDLGKLAVPAELLEKPGRLDIRELQCIQDHALHTRRLLERIPDLGHGIQWAAQHHERLDGSGYPDHSKGDEIAFGSRVLAVADIFTAITEERPYRSGVSSHEVISILHNLTEDGYLDTEVYQAVESNFKELNQVRQEAQVISARDYNYLAEGGLI